MISCPHCTTTLAGGQPSSQDIQWWHEAPTQRCPEFPGRSTCDISGRTDDRYGPEDQEGCVESDIENEEE